MRRPTPKPDFCFPRARAPARLTPAAGLALALPALADLLGEPVRVTLPDGRRVVGSLAAIDREGAVVLSDAVTLGSGKPLGTVTVSRANAVRFEARATRAHAAGGDPAPADKPA